MSTAPEHYDRLLAAHYTWMLGGDVPALAQAQAELLAGLGVVPEGPGRTAVDLGAGPGTQSLALAALGFDQVLAVDTSAPLLAELAESAAKAGHGDAVRTVVADLRGALPRHSAAGSVAAVLCMGDTLTHLPHREDVAALLRDAATALAPGGRLVLSFRDLTRPLTGTDRFLPVRSTEDRIMTCFLEYPDEDTALVHDLIHIRDGGGWVQRVSSYPKLRLSAGWVEQQVRAEGLTVGHSETNARGLHVLAAVRP
ncbi:bifunctional 2-polyprenyl-6-hydroxyphenol methylase/3-demethylubiquinol 3-O-methyltransferase UbiG [Kitasatospora sp. SUK 42]|uniref:class I SAM-dependent methyltransferase n=1 Tax=Kitasatospora sp. SUK 42 TaxID=1588882 RepID=UPI0018C9C00B|nr:class I SAM-dependent methyltransferase [Kitasatospora sp. SUK 42]MBV2156746.1 class I SAM-dependent methyltransferase [Kitasatospora sp. SUK 42]